MNNDNLKLISLMLLSAPTSSFLTLLMRSRIDIALIIFFIIILATTILISLHPDVKEEEIWVKSLIAGAVGFGIIVAGWDAIVVFYNTHQHTLQNNLLIGTAVLVVLGGFYVSNRRQQN